MKTIIKFVTFIPLICMFQQTTAQDLTYHIFIGKKRAGTLQVQKTNLPGNDYHLRLEANTSYALMSIYSLSEAKYHDGRLQQAFTLQKLNGKMRENSSVQRDPSVYRICADDDKSTYADDITYSVAMLYHFEPNGVTKVFSERFGKFCHLREVNPHRYKLEMPDGKATTYTYQNGVCSEVYSEHTLATVRFQLVEDKQLARK